MVKEEAKEKKAAEDKAEAEMSEAQKDEKEVETHYLHYATCTLVLKIKFSQMLYVGNKLWKTRFYLFSFS